MSDFFTGIYTRILGKNDRLSDLDKKVKNSQAEIERLKAEIVSAEEEAAMAKLLSGKISREELRKIAHPKNDSAQKNMEKVVAQLLEKARAINKLGSSHGDIAKEVL